MIKSTNESLDSLYQKHSVQYHKIYCHIVYINLTPITKMTPTIDRIGIGSSNFEKTKVVFYFNGLVGCQGKIYFY